jgi:hypothetical protein
MKGFLVVVAILLTAAACGGGSGNNSGGTSYAPAQNAPKSNSGQTSQGAAQPGDTTGGSTSGASGSITVPNNVPTLAGPPVIRQAQLNISVGSGTFGSKLSEVRTIVETNGGYIAGTDAQAGPATDTTQPSQLTTGVINFMVPAANFDATIDQVSKVGTLKGEHITGTDVSAQYVDFQARLDNAEAQHQIYLALLAKATNTNDVIAIENQIGQITAQIEQLKGQIKYLNDNTAYSSITVTLTEGAPAAQQQTGSDSWGFATALNAAAHNFVATINYVVSGIGAVGPLLVLVLAGYLVWRRRRTPPQPKHA